MAKKVQHLVNAFLAYAIKSKDEELFYYASTVMTEIMTLEDFDKAIKSFLNEKNTDISESDRNFFENAALDLINKVNKPIINMTKITKAVALFEKNGLELGVDYSFHKGKIRMKKESQEKIKKLLG